MFAKEGYQGDREGLAIYAGPNGIGYLVSSDQVEGGSRLWLYRREGADGDPHNHRETVAVIPTMSDATDGLEVATQPFPGFPRGLVVMMNNGPRNFLIYSWQDVEAVRRRAVLPADPYGIGRFQCSRAQRDEPIGLGHLARPFGELTGFLAMVKILGVIA